MNIYKSKLIIRIKHKLVLLTLLCLSLTQNVFAQNSKQENSRNENPKAQSSKTQNSKANEIEKSSETSNDNEEKPDVVKTYNIATVQILNKTTAKNSMLDLRIVQTVNLGAINVKSHKCWMAPLDQKPETKILLEVFENKNSQELDANPAESKRIFYGWLFASSPSLSGLEHPIYDIISITCKNK